MRRRSSTANKGHSPILKIFSGGGGKEDEKRSSFLGRRQSKEKFGEDVISAPTGFKVKRCVFFFPVVFLFLT